MTDKKTLPLQPSHIHAIITTTSKTNPAKKAVYLSCQKRQSTSPTKKGNLPLLPKKQSNPKKKKEKKKKQKEEAEEEAKEEEEQYIDK